MFPKCIDLTSLYGSESQQDIENLVDFAEQYSKYIAAICVSPQWVETAYTFQRRNTTVKIATVINFPNGDHNVDFRMEAYNASNNGATEFDMPIDWQEYNHNGYDYIIEQTKKLYNTIKNDDIIKIILESGELKPELVESACWNAIKGGANFLKTSTGKTKYGATLDAAHTICKVIRYHYLSTNNKMVGFKASGGIKTLKQCQDYIGLVERTLWPKWLYPEYFRLGIGFNAAKDIIEELECIQN